MTRFGHAQVLGFSEDVQKAIEKESAILKENGTDPDVLRASVVTHRERTVALNAEQEALKRQLKATTGAYENSLRSLYIVSSGALDVLIAAARKDSHAAKNLGRLRSRVRHPRDASKGETVPK